jgi:hypothetical protein
MVYCTHCGAANQTQATYCSACGKFLQAPSPLLLRKKSGSNNLLGSLLTIAFALSLVGGFAIFHLSIANLNLFPSLGGSSSSATTPNQTSGSTTFVNCNDVPTTLDEVRSALNLNNNIEIGSPQASCPGGKPGGWLIDPNHTGVTATLHPGMCVDFDGRSTNFSNEKALGWTVPSDWHNVTPVRAYIIQDTIVTSEGLTVYWSPCQHVQP